MNDLISRQEVIDMRLIDADVLEEVLEKIPSADIKNIDGQAYVLVRLSQVFNVIEHAPTIEPERKKGKKIVKSNGRMGYWACDKCGETIHPDDNFCSNCWAKMEEDV